MLAHAQMHMHKQAHMGPGRMPWKTDKRWRVESVTSYLTADSRNCIRVRADTMANNITLIFSPMRFAYGVKREVI